MNRFAKSSIIFMIEKEECKNRRPKGQIWKKGKIPLVQFPQFVKLPHKSKNNFLQEGARARFFNSLSLAVSVSANRLFCFSYKGIFF